MLAVTLAQLSGSVAVQASATATTADWYVQAAAGRDSSQSVNTHGEKIVSLTISHFCGMLMLFTVYEPAQLQSVWPDFVDTVAVSPTVQPESKTESTNFLVPVSLDRVIFVALI